MSKKKYDLTIGADKKSGQVVFHMEKTMSGQTVDTGWIVTGAGPGDYRIRTSVGTGDGIRYDGSAQLFADAPGMLSKIKLGAAVDEQTGAVRIAVKVKNPEHKDLTVFWSLQDVSPSREVPAPAGELPENSGNKPYRTDGQPRLDISEPEEDTFYIENAPSMLHGGWKYTLRAHVPEGAKGQVRWELTDGETAGTIDDYGCYTASAKPGAYEVKAYLEDGDALLAEASVYLIVL